MSSITYDNELKPEEIFTDYVTPSWKSIQIAYVTPIDYHISNIILIHHEQRMLFGCKFTQMITNGQMQDSKYKVLRCFYDHQLEVIRILGRLMDTNQNLLPTQYQILMHPDSKYARQLIYSIHLDAFCAGIRYVIHHVRNKYWLPRIRKTFASVIKHCILCKRRRAEKTAMSPPVTGLQQ